MESLDAWSGSRPGPTKLPPKLIFKEDACSDQGPAGGIVPANGRKRPRETPHRARKATGTNLAKVLSVKQQKALAKICLPTVTKGVRLTPSACRDASAKDDMSSGKAAACILGTTRVPN